MFKYSIVIPTYNAGEKWIDCLKAVKEQVFQPVDVLVIDSTSEDKTVEIAKEHGVNIIQIAKNEFDHGHTRQIALDKIIDIDFVIYCTQDAILSDNQTLNRILNYFGDPKIGAVYGRQLPRKSANLFEIYERQFSYPSESHIYSYHDRKAHGMKTCFLSNAFAAYRLEALEQVGGFPSNIIVSEDMYVGAKMLKAGWKLGYCAEASVIHSHSYNLRELFGRYFDVGVFNAQESWIKEEFGSAESEGFKYVKAEIGFLWNKNPWLFPYALIRTFIKFAGYKVGLMERFLPVSVKKSVSRQKQYWQ